MIMALDRIDIKNTHSRILTPRNLEEYNDFVSGVLNIFFFGDWLCWLVFVETVDGPT